MWIPGVTLIFVYREVAVVVCSRSRRSRSAAAAPRSRASAGARRFHFAAALRACAACEREREFSHYAACMATTWSAARAATERGSTGKLGDSDGRAANEGNPKVMT